MHIMDLYTLAPYVAQYNDQQADTVQGYVCRNLRNWTFMTNLQI